MPATGTSAHRMGTRAKYNLRHFGILAGRQAGRHTAPRHAHRHQVGRHAHTCARMHMECRRIYGAGAHSKAALTAFLLEKAGVRHMSIHARVHICLHTSV